MQHNGFNTLANFPHAFGGDKVYAYDINQELSAVGGFTGEAIDLFTDFQKGQVSPAGVANPKVIRLVFQGPVESSVIGFGSEDTSLSNGKLILKGVDGQILGEVDQSADDTKRGVLFFSFEQTTFIELILELHTDDEVTISGAWIPKSSRVAVAAIDGLIPTGGQSATPLIADAEWVSGIIDTKNYVWIIASAYSDVASATDGFVIEFSTDKVNWFWQDPYTIGAGKAKTFSNQPSAQYLRVRYKNGAIGQTSFEVTVQLKPTASKSSSHRINSPIDGEDDSELIKAIITAFSEVTGISENVTSFRRALQVDNALVHRAGVNELFTQVGSTTTTLTAQANVGDTDIDVLSSAAFSIGDQFIMNSELFHFHITDITANNIQLDRPIDFVHLIGTSITNITNNMAVIGSLLAPVSFKVAPPIDEIWQLTRIIPVMIASTAMDDGKFGGIPALTNGAVLRAYRDGVFRTGAVWKTNGDIALDMYNLDYTSKAPAGENGMRGRWTFTAAEFIIELDGATGDYAEILIQDDNSANTGFYLKAQGRIFGA